ncbi:hypothetical protein QBC41DRAFT_112239 [Cercophora samala]|uniref:Uncharacterized protein n=1 Tax=Cercophora samala TaxID=330535 RepID=A0AA39ZDQ8_9PEZI|nr:hypothetical protein QBC41DRAFT_112239 [Cercophora samala]
MSSNAADPVVGVADSNMSFFRKHTPLGSLSGSRAPLNSIAITPFLQTLFTIPTVVSPSPQTAGLQLDGDDKTDPVSPVESSPETPASSVPSDTAVIANDESKRTDTGAAKEIAPPVEDHANTYPSTLVPDSAWLDETLNAPVSPDTILALPNTLTVPGPAVVESPVPVESLEIAPVAAIVAVTPASPAVELLSTDPTWMDDALVAPVTPAAILALPQKTLIFEVDALEQSDDQEESVTATEETNAESAPVPAPVPEQPTTLLEQVAAESSPTPVALIADNAWMDQSLNAPVTPYALLALPEKNMTAVDFSVPAPPPSLPAEAVQAPAPSRTVDSFIAPVTPLALLALPEKN